MKIITDFCIDFDKYLAAPADAARVRPASSWTDEVIDMFYGDTQAHGAVLPWSKTHNSVRLRPHEVSLWAGYNGSGKTMLLNQIMLGAMSQGDRVCIASLEMTPRRLMYRMARQAIGVREPAIPAIRSLYTWTDNRLWLYDQPDRITPDRVIAVARYCREELQINHFVIDSLMKCGIAPDDYAAQKDFVDRLCVHARDTGMHVHIVAHGRKGDTEKRHMDKHDVKGASEITDLVDNVFTLWRNKGKEEAVRCNVADEKELDMPDAIITCSKQRHGEWEGRVSLWFHPDSFQYTAHNGDKPIDFMALSESPAWIGAGA